MQLKHTTLCYLLDGNKVLLAMKKRGRGVGKWNGVGGKLDPGETPEAAAIRETEEEIGVTPTDLTKVAEVIFLDVDVPEDKQFNQLCHVFLCTAWVGEPIETEEMRPRWYATSNLPRNEMWESDVFWLPRALSGEKLTATFTFDSDQVMTSHKTVLGRSQFVA